MVVTAGQAPYKNIVTHGFVLDEFGFKMSKSQGNVIAPNDIILGTAAAQKLRDALEAEAVATAQLGKRRDDESASAGGGDASASSKKKKKKKKQKKKKPAARFDVGYGADVARLWAASADYSKVGTGSGCTVAWTADRQRSPCCAPAGRADRLQGCRLHQRDVAQVPQHRTVPARQPGRLPPADHGAFLSGCRCEQYRIRRRPDTEAAGDVGHVPK